MKLPIDTGSVTFAAAGPFQRPDRLLEKIVMGDLANVDFNDLIRLIIALGFREVRRRESHRVFVREGVSELVNVQSEVGDAKRYQVRQITNLIRRYILKLEED